MNRQLERGMHTGLAGPVHTRNLYDQEKSSFCRLHALTSMTIGDLNNSQLLHIHVGFLSPLFFCLNRPGVRLP